MILFVADISLKVVGMTGLKNKLELIAKKEAVKKIVRDNGKQLHRKMVQKAVFTKGHSTGATRISITMQIGDDGFSVTVKPGTHYAGYLEKGTRFMSKQPFVLPALKEQKVKFRKDLEALVK
ncbi:TPA: HK97 gp10 family phage protein [Streptococcus equi subsp. zooepidemicus]|nr:HK97 gp10 family phage protein [Streptococcus equi subsp. zooepidemicus]